MFPSKSVRVNVYSLEDDDVAERLAFLFKHEEAQCFGTISCARSFASDKFHIDVTSQIEASDILKENLREKSFYCLRSLNVHAFIENSFIRAMLREGTGYLQSINSVDSFAPVTLRIAKGRVTVIVSERDASWIGLKVDHKLQQDGEPYCVCSCALGDCVPLPHAWGAVFSSSFPALDCVFLCTPHCSLPEMVPAMCGSVSLHDPVHHYQYLQSITIPKTTCMSSCVASGDAKSWAQYYYYVGSVLQGCSTVLSTVRDRLPDSFVCEFSAVPVSQSLEYVQGSCVVHTYQGAFREQSVRQLLNSVLTGALAQSRSESDGDFLLLHFRPLSDVLGSLSCSMLIQGSRIVCFSKPRS
eukprot:ANDGO_01082.mRNA.1 hypothetical protein